MIHKDKLLKIFQCIIKLFLIQAVFSLIVAFVFELLKIYPIHYALYEKSIFDKILGALNAVLAIPLIFAILFMFNGVIFFYRDFIFSFLSINNQKLKILFTIILFIVTAIFYTYPFEILHLEAIKISLAMILSVIYIYRKQLLKHSSL